MILRNFKWPVSKLQLNLPRVLNDCSSTDKAADRVSLSPMCTATYIAEDVMYNITAVWSIDNPLVTEAIGSFTALLEVIVIEGSGPVGRTVHETRQLEEFEVSSFPLCDVQQQNVYS